MKASMTKASMDASIRKNSGTKRALLSIPGAILTPNTGAGCYDEAIANRTIKTKLSGIISKK
jgi:hypothetical protein